jgi:REP element-mobilizing transposase RayT
MSRKYRFLDQQQAYFVSFATVNWVDVFTRSIYCDRIVESLKYCQKEKGLILYAWCIMPSHVHLIIGTKDKLMQDIMRDLKSYTSRVIKEDIQSYSKESRREWLLWMFERVGRKNGNNREWQLWQQHNHPIELSSNKIIDQKLEYVHYNPVSAGYVESPEHWMYSSARNYYEKPGLIDVEICY